MGNKVEQQPETIESYNDGTVTDALAGNLQEIKSQIAHYGVTLERIVMELQDVPDGRAIEAFRTQVMQKQLYIENLIDETTCELDLLKRDVASLFADLREVKEALRMMQAGQVLENEDDVQMARRDTEPSPPIVSAELDEADRQVLAAIRRHPLSSIPPRQLSENEALNFLRAIDDIVTKRRNSEFPITAASSK